MRAAQFKLQVLLASMVTIWCGNFIALKVCLRVMSPVGVTAFRVLTAAVLLYFIQRYSPGRYPFRKLRKVDYWLFLKLAFVGLLLNQVLFISGLKFTTVAHSALVVTFGPLFTLVAEGARKAYAHKSLWHGAFNWRDFLLECGQEPEFADLLSLGRSPHLSWLRSVCLLYGDEQERGGAIWLRVGNCFHLSGWHVRISAARVTRAFGRALAGGVLERIAGILLCFGPCLCTCPIDFLLCIAFHVGLPAGSPNLFAANSDNCFFGADPIREADAEFHPGWEHCTGWHLADPAPVSRPSSAS